MKKVIKEVLDVEEKVNAVIKQAQAKASEIKIAADKDMSEKITKAKEQGRELLQTIVADAKKEACRLGDENIKQAKEKRAALMSRNLEKIDVLVDDICKIILTTNYETDTK